MARRSRIQPVAPVTWRDGVHITGTPIWCDARRRRDVCFVSSADRVGKTGHGQLIATPLALAMLGAGTGHLAVPLHRPFTLGTLRLELVDAARTLGSAALHVAIGGRGVLYAGEVGVEAEVRACDAVVVAAAADRALPELDDVAGELVGWTRKKLDASPRLVVETATDALVVAARLADEGIAVAGSRAVREAARRAGKLATVPKLRAPGKTPSAIVLVEREARELGRVPVAYVSARERKSGTQFPWPFTADRARLLAWIEQTGARDVYLTGPHAEAIVAALGPRARVLGPPTQMSLFRA